MIQRKKAKKPKQKQRKKHKEKGTISISLDEDILQLIQKEAEFLRISNEEYCTLVFHTAAILRQSSLDKPLENTEILKTVIHSPLLLSLVKSFANQYLSSTLKEFLEKDPLLHRTEVQEPQRN